MEVYEGLRWAQGVNVGAIIIRIGFWGVYSTIIIIPPPQKTNKHRVGSCLGAKNRLSGRGLLVVGWVRS